MIACNTATSVTIDDLRKSFSFPIIGMEPAVKPAISISNNKRVLVFATELTLKEPKFNNLVNQVDKGQQVDFIPLQGLVTLAENFEFDHLVIQNYLREKLENVDLQKYGTIVLGCTHFPYFKKEISEFIPRQIQIIDGNKGTVAHLKNKLEGGEGNGNGQIEFYKSGRLGIEGDFLKYLNFLNE